MFNIPESPSDNLSLVVTIPCYNEPDLITSLDSLYNCDLIEHKHIEVLVVINASEAASDEVKAQNLASYQDALVWKQGHNKTGIEFYFYLNNELPKKHAGVGLARRIAMDQAVIRLNKVNNPNGVIVCFDADSQCDSNYLHEILSHFETNVKTPGCSIYFEHPLIGDNYSKEIYQAIVAYETHLRYYNLAVRYTGYPGAYHTVGSSMAVRASAYNKQGGMNKRKAGEDFYFLHKIIALGDFSELNSTRVIPSPRPSDRVPFGTGRAVGEMINADTLDYQTYAFKSFKELKQFFAEIPHFYNDHQSYFSIPPAVKSFLKHENLDEKIKEFHANSSNYKTFVKRFFAWFNAFRILKFVHHSRDHFYPNNSVDLEVQQLFKAIKVVRKVVQPLSELRDIEKGEKLSVNHWVD